MVWQLIVTDFRLVALEINPSINIEPIILPKKTIFQLISLIEQSSSHNKNI